MKRKVLFVDDEPNVLDGLRRMLRPMAKEWQMFFEASGKSALELLEKETMDVVVSDMRMPEIDGATLLNEVQRKYPRTIRIVLSGQSDLEAIYRAVGSTHQYICKPCDSEELKNAVARSLALRDLLADERLRRLVGSLKSVPCLPSVYTKLVAELQSPDASIKAIGAIVAQDLGMTTKILQLVNSAFFGLARTMTDPAEAAAMLGVETIKALVLTFGVLSQFQTTPAVIAPEALMARSLEVARLARDIARLEQAQKTDVDAAFLGGILHDIGLLVVAANLPDTFNEVIDHARKNQVPFSVAERAVMGASHAEIGGYLLALWGIPDLVVEAVSFHHTPQLGVHAGFQPVTAVHAAATLLEGNDFASFGIPAEEVNRDYLDLIGAAERLSRWQNLALETLSSR